MQDQFKYNQYLFSTDFQYGKYRSDDEVKHNMCSAFKKFWIYVTDTIGHSPAFSYRESVENRA